MPRMPAQNRCGAAARADRVEAELALIERLAPAEREQVHLVAIVADEQQRRADRRLEPGGADPQAAAAEASAARAGSRDSIASRLLRPVRSCLASRKRTMSG